MEGNWEAGYSLQLDECNWHLDLDWKEIDCAMVFVIFVIVPVVGAAGDSNKCWTQIRWVKRVPLVGIKFLLVWDEVSACLGVKFDVKKIVLLLIFLLSSSCCR